MAGHDNNSVSNFAGSQSPGHSEAVVDEDSFSVSATSKLQQSEENTSNFTREDDNTEDDNHSVCHLRDGLLMRERLIEKGSNSETKQQQQQKAATRMARKNKVSSNEPLLGGFALLRAVQLINFDVYYINANDCDKVNGENVGVDGRDKNLLTSGGDIDMGGNDVEAGLVDRSRDSLASSSAALVSMEQQQQLSSWAGDSSAGYRTILNDLSDQNPIQRYISRSRFLSSICQLLKCCLSMIAIILVFSKNFSTILLCLIARFDSSAPKRQLGETNAVANSDSKSMAVLVLILMNISSMYILYSTVFSGHLLWNLLSQRLFLVSRRYQYKTMLCLLVFIYLEFFVNISLINNLFDTSFGPAEGSPTGVGSYYTLAKLRAFVTEHDDQNRWLDLFLTVVQFARGIIRISPYIAINYAIICLTKHISIIRNQQLLTDSLKRRQKLRLVVTNRGAKQQAKAHRKKRVIFATDNSADCLNSVDQNGINNQENNKNLANGLGDPARVSLGNILPSSSPTSFASLLVSEANSFKAPIMNELAVSPVESQPSLKQQHSMGGYTEMVNEDPEESAACETSAEKKLKREKEENFLDRIGDFDELEAYITNLYIFTGRLNRLMSRQGLTLFFIVHNLVISTSLIIPEAIKGGIVMAYVIRFLLILIGFVPFRLGQSLNTQLEQLSKQIDRIIIQQQFISRRRDNLVRIRELLHDIRVNCGGISNFNIKTGIKYVVVALASAFFIEQEGK